uniref:Testis expressed 101 n=1 Tax=Myotis lucifugus TaxID=59463 RepID=G1Q7C9_MYOLU
MGARHAQGLLLLFLLRASSTRTLAQHLYCHKGISMSLEEDPRAFNWTTERVETCDNGALCQESLMMVKSGAKMALLATKGCNPEGIPAITLVQHSPPPGIMVVSYSSYCEHSFCNNRKNIPEIWNPEISEQAPNMSTTFHCPTCLALGACSSAPSLPCPIDTTRCYQGKLQVAGGDVDSTLEVKGCTSLPRCGLMSGIFTIGPMWVKEMCPYQSLIQSRKVGNGATTWLPISIGRFGLLLLLLL